MNRRHRALPLFAAASMAFLLGACATPSASNEPEIRLFSAEDQHVKIDELRVRGVTQRAVVTPKGADGEAGRPYQVLMAPGGHDPSGEHRDASGQRVWTVLTF